MAWEKILKGGSKKNHSITEEGAHKEVGRVSE